VCAQVELMEYAMVALLAVLMASLPVISLAVYLVALRAAVKV